METAPEKNKRLHFLLPLLIGLVIVVVSGSLVGLGLTGKGPLARLGATSPAMPTATPLPPVSITEFPLPRPGDPDGITAGPDGNLWFTEGSISGEVMGGKQIGRITPAGKITEFPLPMPNTRPWGIAAGPDGNLWFTENTSNRIGRITPVGKITEFSLPFGSIPWGITAGPEGALWFTGADKIGRITLEGQITEFSLSEGSEPRGITAGPDGSLWFSEVFADKIGRITSGA